MNILLLNQCFHPDVVSSGQHLTDLAVALADRGHRVTVIASSRGYDNPQNRFPRHENWKGIKIIRLACTGFGKKSMWRRSLDFSSFLVSCLIQLALMPSFHATVAMTSPPLISCLAALFVQVKGGRLLFWVMDLNPDEAVATGCLPERSWITKILDRLMLYSFRRSNKIMVLDRFMKQRVQSKGISEDKLVVIPPWAHDDVVYFSPEGRKNFRATYMLTEKFVVMYSGNLSPCHPLNTLLQAALRLREQPKIIFCFVGGGSEIERVKSFSRKHLLANMTFLPYQPLDQLSSSLSSADMQVVVMGDAFPGIVHPCKIYNILVVGAPILYIGPSESHIMDIFDRLESGDAACAVRHGDSDAVVNYILGLARNFQCSKSQGNFQLAQNFSKEILLPKMLEWIEMFEPSASESKRVVPCVK